MITQSSNNDVISTQDLAIGYQGSNGIVAKHISIEIKKGELVCLLGPNGCGKSTLIKTLAGLQPAISGSIFLQEDELSGMSVSALARRLSIVLTERVALGNFSVYDLVALGRLPYPGIMGKLTPKDIEHIDWALKITDSQELGERDLMQLSDGEKQKVMVARALAQDTPLMLLDEPTAHLDLPNRISILKMLRKLVLKSRKTIALSTHELNLALQIADRILIFDDDQIISDTPQHLMESGAIERIFGFDDITLDQETGTFKFAAFERTQN